MTQPSNPGPDLSVDLNGLTLENPVIAASGTFGYGLEFAPFLNLNRLGGISTKGLSMKPRIGNPVPRVIEGEGVMLNAIGLENVGFEAFVRDKLPQLHKFRCRLICNFFGNTVEEYAGLAKALSELDRVDALEMNISCPNVKEGGLQFSSDPRMVGEVVSAVRKASKKYLIVKLSPNVTDITEIARAAEEAGANAVSLINTLLGMVVDLETGMPYLANGTGGVSGPGIKPVALQMVHRTARTVKIPVIGIGGIRTAEDALEFLMAGARAVQVGTANFFDPCATVKVIDGIRDWCRNRGIDRIADLPQLKGPA